TFLFFFQAEDGIRDWSVTGVQRVLFRSLLIAAAASVFCADATRWGSVVDGLQLGIGATSTPEPALHGLLKNAGPRVQEVPTGFEGEPDPPLNVTITARAPREGDLQVFDLNAARYWPPDIGP